MLNHPENKDKPCNQISKPSPCENPHKLSIWLPEKSRSKFQAFVCSKPYYVRDYLKKAGESDPAFMGPASRFFTGTLLPSRMKVLVNIDTGHLISTAR